MSTRSVDQIILAITTWLELGNEERTLAALRGWDSDDWALGRKVVFMHGVGAYLHQCITPTSSLSTAFPAGFRDYLASQFALNSARIQRVHSLLSAILAQASQNGIDVIPLKGSFLSMYRQLDPRLRPMADIDLLIRPEDQPAMRRLLEPFGYQMKRPKTLFSHHDHYSRPQDRVISWEGEHPDNPLPVEVHTSLRRVLWGDIYTPDLTASLWESARPGEISGQPAWIADTEAHYTYLCLHALVHFLEHKGRLMHLLDLARLAPYIPDFSRLSHAGLIYPVVRLASRALPGAFEGVDLSRMADLASEGVRCWADYTALDGRCGLNNQRSPQRPSWIAGRWAFWHPTLIRLALAYPGTPLPIATLAVLGRFVHHLVKRVVNLPLGKGI